MAGLSVRNRNKVGSVSEFQRRSVESRQLFCIRYEIAVFKQRNHCLLLFLLWIATEDCRLKREVFATDIPSLCISNEVKPISTCVDKIGDSDMVFGEMRPRIRFGLLDIRLTVRKNSEKSNQVISSTGIEPTHECKSGLVGKRLSRLSYAGGYIILF
ncbi:hypothetical protein ANN_11894 [Periplaneta americana]|uniref:Uncharacterized protein n=1 Tax=Periplaneta americana TaxID=6978 RepID=A0ABQ8T6B8_PERAM|nr:hypothetical protein ANN_11894 [Periplaneta americana]